MMGKLCSGFQDIGQSSNKFASFTIIDSFFQLIKVCRDCSGVTFGKMRRERIRA